MITKFLKYRNVSIGALITLIFLIASFFIKQLWPVTAVLIMNLFDVLGYWFVLRRMRIEENDKLDIVPDNLIVPAYRIIQFMFNICIYIFTYLLAGPIAVVQAFIIFWFGLQDILFYFFLKVPLEEKWTWLKWTPLGFILKVLTKKQVLFQAIFGIILALSLFLINI